jgi:hypothetical protein
VLHVSPAEKPVKAIAYRVPPGIYSPDTRAARTTTQRPDSCERIVVSRGGSSAREESVLVSEWSQCAGPVAVPMFPVRLSSNGCPLFCRMEMPQPPSLDEFAIDLGSLNPEEDVDGLFYPPVGMGMGTPPPPCAS